VSKAREMAVTAIAEGDTPARQKAGRRRFQVASRRGEWDNEPSGNDCEGRELRQVLDVVALRPGPAKTALRARGKVLIAARYAGSTDPSDPLTGLTYPVFPAKLLEPTGGPKSASLPGGHTSAPTMQHPATVGRAFTVDSRPRARIVGRASRRPHRGRHAS
jgi:hypothetical protein